MCSIEVLCNIVHTLPMAAHKEDFILNVLPSFMVETINFLLEKLPLGQLIARIIAFRRVGSIFEAKIDSGL